MYTDVNEAVEVAAVFFKDRAIPTQLKWNSRVYHIKEVNLIHYKFEGRELIYYFSVSDSVNFFKLSFHTRNLRWNLEQIYDSES